MKDRTENKTSQKRISDFRLRLFTVVVVLVSAGLVYWRNLQSHRVHRSQAQTVAGEFGYLTRRFNFEPPWDSRMSKVRAQEDLDELEWLLENRYSYLHLKGVDYQSALDSIRCSLSDGIPRSVFGYQLAKCIELPLVKERPFYGLWPRLETEITSWKDILPESRILKRNIGYLRIVTMSSEPKFLDGLVETMDRFRSTDGLIIDLRSNGGGRRTPLRVLLPFFMAPDDPPHIVNVAAYRLGTKNIKEDFKARYLHSASSSRWSKAEREVIGRFAKTFKPEWKPPKEQFSPWHYFVISPIIDNRYYHYEKPVILLMNSGNFSACDIFLGGFKSCKNVTLMGQSSGGGSGCTQEYQLSNSGIRINLSRMASFQPNGKLYDGNGLQPDVIVEPIPSDFIGRSDTVLDKAIQTVNEKNNSLHLRR